ncbi:hypothetical protein FEE59_03070 [Herbaspirillum sp. RU 5E]|nr:hypothetical protein [Herbaspirillum sp. RU 5E]
MTKTTDLPESHVHYDSPEAASVQTVTGWVSRDGRFWGKDEHMARFCGATHRQCAQCQAVEISINNVYCNSCLELRRIEKYKAMPREQWDGAALLYLDGTDRYFQDPDEAREYANDKGIAFEDLHLIICEPKYASPLDPFDQFEGDLPDGCDVPYELVKAFDVLNEVIRNHREPLCWYPSGTALDFASLPATAASSDGGDK